jgi:mono/diheme cytochrome c family protein
MLLDLHHDSVPTEHGINATRLEEWLRARLLARYGRVAAHWKGSARDRIRLTIPGAAAIVLLLACPASAQDVPGDVVAGRMLAIESCVQCHSLSFEQRLERPYEAPGFDEIADKPQTTALSLRAFLQQPHPTMPNLTLTQEERDNAIAYILSLKRISH